MKKLIFTLPLIFASFNLDAQNSDKFTGSLLWKVTGNGLEYPCYVFGTHHLAEVSFAQNYPGFQQALESSAQVVGELLLDDMGAIQNAMMMHAAMPTGTTYASLLSEEEYKALDEGLKTSLGTGLDQLGQMKPGMINMILALRIYAAVMPEYNPMAHVSIDQYVQQYAAGNGKKVLGLEKAEDQLHALFYADPLEEQAKALACAVKNLHHGEESILNLNKYYAEGNLFGAYAATFNDPDAPCQMSEESGLALNKHRNDKWMDQLPGIFADGPTFVAVGMLHLCGQEGLLYRLDQLGYTVETVK